MSSTLINRNVSIFVCTDIEDLSWSIFPGGTSGKESACQFRICYRHELDPWVGKIPLEEEMITHSRILAWRIPWTEEPGGLQSMGSQGIGHDWVTELNWYLHHLLLPFGYINMKNIMQWNSRRSISLTEEHLIISIRYTFFFSKELKIKCKA